MQVSCVAPLGMEGSRYVYKVMTNANGPLFNAGSFEVRVGPHIENLFGQEMTQEQVGDFSIRPLGIAEAKAQPDDVTFLLKPAYVTSSSAAIRAWDSPIGLPIDTYPTAVGHKTIIEGHMRTEAGLRKIVAEWTVVYGTPITAVTPVLMKTRDIGGGASCGLQVGIEGGAGPNNVGMLVKVCGKITAVDPAGQYVYIDDGCALKDGTQTDDVDNVGVKVKADLSLFTVAKDDFAEAVGIVYVFTDAGGKLRPMITVAPEPPSGLRKLD